MTISHPQSGILVFIGVATVVSLLTVAAEVKKRHSRTLHQKTSRALSEVEQYVANSIRVNMPPARRMGITVEQVNLRHRKGETASSSTANSSAAEEGTVSLRMPIKGNTNIHGTAFAGSLYSLCVLSAWYNLVCHLRATLGDEVLDTLTVVAQSAEISYKKPVWNIKANEHIVATSFLTSGDNGWDGFVNVLKESGKITCNIAGEIRIPTGKPASTASSSGEAAKDISPETTTAVEFRALLCVMLPRSD